MSILYVRLNSEPLATDYGEICDESAEDFLSRALSAAVEANNEQTVLALDFEEIRLFKVGAVRRTLGWLAEHAASAVCLVNLNPEIAFHITNESTVPQLVTNAGTPWLIIEKTGRLNWLGLSPATDWTILAHLMDGGTANLSDLDAPTRDAAMQSGDFFSLDSSGFLRRTEDCELLLLKMERTIEETIASTLNNPTIRTEGHYKLPAGLHTGRVFQTSLLLNQGQFVTRLAMEMARRIRKYRPDALVSNSLFAYVLANEVAGFLDPRPVVLEAYGYPEPRISLASQPCMGLQTVILSDIVSSGTSITSLRSELNRIGANVLRVLAGIEINGAADRADAEAIVSFEDDQYTRFSCLQCQRGLSYQEIDPFTSMALTQHASGPMPNTILSSEEFWQIVFEQDALREGHFSFNGHHFSIFIETPRLLKHSSISKRIAKAVLNDFARRGVMFDSIVFPVHPGAVAFATALWTALRAASERPAPLLIPASKSAEGGYVISQAYANNMSQRSVLILDDGVNFGDTLSGLYFAVAEFAPTAVECLVFVDRLSTFYRRKLTTILQSHTLTSVYHLAIPAVHKIRCPICKERRELLRLLRSSVGEDIRKSAQRKLAELEIQSIDPDVQEVEGEVRVTSDPILAE